MHQQRKVKQIEQEASLEEVMTDRRSKRQGRVGQAKKGMGENLAAGTSHAKAHVASSLVLCVKANAWWRGRELGQIEELERPQRPGRKAAGERTQVLFQRTGEPRKVVHSKICVYERLS